MVSVRNGESDSDWDHFWGVNNKKAAFGLPPDVSGTLPARSELEVNLASKAQNPRFAPECGKP